MEKTQQRTMIDFRSLAGKLGSKIALIRRRNVSGTDLMPRPVQSQISVHCRAMGVGKRSTKASVSAMKLTYLSHRQREDASQQNNVQPAHPPNR